MNEHDTPTSTTTPAPIPTSTQLPFDVWFATLSVSKYGLLALRNAANPTQLYKEALSAAFDAGRASASMPE